MHCCRPVLDEVAGVSYELSEAQYAANEREDTWVQRLLGTLVRLAMWLQPLTTGQVFDAILGLIIDRVGALSCPWPSSSCCGAVYLLRVNALSSAWLASCMPHAGRKLSEACFRARIAAGMQRQASHCLNRCHSAPCTAVPIVVLGT